MEATPFFPAELLSIQDLATFQGHPHTQLTNLPDENYTHLEFTAIFHVYVSGNRVSFHLVQHLQLYSHLSWYPMIPC